MNYLFTRSGPLTYPVSCHPNTDKNKNYRWLSNSFLIMFHESEDPHNYTFNEEERIMKNKNTLKIPDMVHPHPNSMYKEKRVLANGKLDADFCKEKDRL